MKKPAVPAAGLDLDFNDSNLGPAAGEQQSPQSQPVLDTDSCPILNNNSVHNETDPRQSQGTRRQRSLRGGVRRRSGRRPSALRRSALRLEAREDSALHVTLHGSATRWSGAGQRWPRQSLETVCQWSRSQDSPWRHGRSTSRAASLRRRLGARHLPSSRSPRARGGAWRGPSPAV